jgi:hypothetical protein
VSRINKILDSNPYYQLKLNFKPLPVDLICPSEMNFHTGKSVFCKLFKNLGNLASSPFTFPRQHNLLVPRPQPTLFPIKNWTTIGSPRYVFFPELYNNECELNHAPIPLACLACSQVTFIAEPRWTGANKNTRSDQTLLLQIPAKIQTGIGLPQ